MLNFLFTLQSMVAGRIERDDKGATAVEYGLLVALIAAVIVGSVYTIGQEVSTGFKAVVTELQK